jgi:hypothetical protein
LGESQIGQQRFEQWPLPHVTAALRNQGHIAEFAPRRLLSLRARESIGHQLVDPLLDVSLNRHRDIVITAAAGKEPGERAHGEPPML